MSNRLALVFIKSFSNNKLYEELGFEVKELCNINNTGYINKSKAIHSRVSKGS
jgi:hypothetical protein